MNDYPSGSLDRNFPLLAVSGLSTGPTKPLFTDDLLRDKGVWIRSGLPPVDKPEAKTILRHIQETDASQLSWHARESSRKYRFNVKAIGRDLLLPPRHATLPPDFGGPLSPGNLHSPFSPLSPGSTLYPDGIIDTRWLEKHQSFVPGILLCFYSLASDPSLATMQDNQLKSDINTVKNALARSGYRTRLAVVILSDESPGAMAPYQDRLEIIRRQTGLDPKTSLFVVPTRRSEGELEGAVDSVLSALYVQAIGYYRDLGRHARKKKGRGIAPQPTVPPTSGTSHTLSLQGWNVRYDFKTGVLGEFRQDMDVALRSYEQAYETLLGGDMMETIPSWSPRFNGARLLADTIAIRILRCLLWTGQSTGAVRRWQAHRRRLADMVERLGSGTRNYGWEAWEARWAENMANLIEKIDYPELDPATGSLFRPAEKALSAERLQPWELLHHAGYWYRTAARHAMNRRALALAMPEGDREAPDTSPVARSAAKPFSTYDTYLCPEPHEEWPLEGQGTNHADKILTYLSLARVEFQKRRQIRLAAEVALECCRELERLQGWAQLVELLAPVWRHMAFRHHGWWEIADAISWTLRAAAAQVGKADLVIAIDWELLNKNSRRRADWHYDLLRSLDGVKVERRPEVNISDDHVDTFLSAAFVFKQDEGRSGQTCAAQLSITSNAFPGTPPVVLGEVSVEFEGGLRPIRINGGGSSQQATGTIMLLTTVSLHPVESPNGVAIEDQAAADAKAIPTTVLEGTQDLTVHPGQTRVFELMFPLREAGEARATAIQVSLAAEAFSVNCTMKMIEGNTIGFWYMPSSARRVTRPDSHVMTVLPRPPKMEVKFIKVLNQYYAGEPIRVEVVLVNEEDTEADTRLDVHMYGQDVPAFGVEALGTAQRSSTGGSEETSINGVPIGIMATSKSKTIVITIDPIGRPTAYDLTVRACYNLVTDPGTPIVQVVAAQLNVVNPFEASYDLAPRLHDEAWPSMFDPRGLQEPSDEGGLPHGPLQKWCLITRFASFASADVLVLDLDVQVVATQGAASCTISGKQLVPAAGLRMTPRTMEEAYFDVVAQKRSLGDGAPVTADLAFVIKWQRIPSSEDPVGSPPTTNTTTFYIDPFYVTVSEPRVLATVSYSPTSCLMPCSTTDGSVDGSVDDSVPSSATPQLIILDITIENPSSHFLKFALTMEPNDEYAFSGPKATTLNVLPVSRRRVTYRLLPLVRGQWIRPTLVVRDNYFQKVLRIIPTEGMKPERDGVLVWVPGKDEDGEAPGKREEALGVDSPVDEKKGPRG